MGVTPNGSTPEPQFALVSYIPDPLGIFLDRLRLEMTPACRPRAHVTVLPPRNIRGAQTAAVEEVQRGARAFPAFEVELGEVDRFDQSDVIYLSVAKGQDELRGMYRALNTGAVDFKERFAYHPHITLAQDIRHEEVERLQELARRRWADYRGSRKFPVEILAFVSNRNGSDWVDLANIPLLRP